MKTLFTIHAGEFLVGSEIERLYPSAQIWLPSKDTGIDLLVTNARNTRAVTLQVKYSRDFVPKMDLALAQGLRASGWWTYSRKKLRASKADLWIFVLSSFSHKKTHYILVHPAELDRRLGAIHGTSDRVQSYFCVTEGKEKCWDARNLPRRDYILITNHTYSNQDRDFTEFLDNWKVLEQTVK
jgi:hypothetical protein